MSDRVRDMLLVALGAGQHGATPADHIAEAVKVGDRQLRIDQLHFDSLAWMEFCISIELQSGQALTPEDIENMRYMFEIEEWLRAKL
jgi:hypothetical protein